MREFYHHVGELLQPTKNSHHIFCSNNGKSKGDFFQRVTALSQALQSFGMQPGDRVAIAALNSDIYLEWMLAVPCSGGIFAPLNYRWNVREAAAAIQLVEPVILALDSHCSSWFEPLRSKCSSIRAVFFIENSIQKPDKNCVDSEAVLSSFLKRETSLQLRYAPNETALICFTSGTTGTPKGVALSHRALLFQSLIKLLVVGYSTTDVYLHTAPLCQIGGISSALAMLMAGSRHVFLPRFQTRLVFEALKKFQVSSMIVVPTMLSDLTNSRKEEVFPSVSKILNGAGPIPETTLQHVFKMFPRSHIFSAYGMTEAASSITFMRVEKTLPQPGAGICVGKPVSLVETRISSSGTLETRGPQVMLGYWKQPEKTSEVLDSDGWLDTGDVARIDDSGNLWLLGRARDMIKTGGHNVYASEVEMVISQHPSVAMVAVVGVPDSRLQELVAAVVVLERGWSWRGEAEEFVIDDEAGAFQMVSAQELSSHCTELGLSRYKIPRHFVHRHDPLPLTSTGKFKKELIKPLVSVMFSRL